MIEFAVLPSGEQPVWEGAHFVLGAGTARVITYSSNIEGWDENLTDLHETEAGDGQHPIDVASRRNAISSLRYFGFPARGTLLEIGCSSGFLLRDLKREFPHAEIVGADIDLGALERLGRTLSGVPLVQMDLLQCELKEHQLDAVVAINVLEHISDDEAALKRMASLLKPGGILVLEVPQGPTLYDYYDAYLRHFRRYSKNELVAKITRSGLQLESSSFLGFVAYLPFWVTKKLNRWRFGRRGERTSRMQEMVRQRIRNTTRSALLDVAFSLESALVGKVEFPAGIRCIAVSRAPMWRLNAVGTRNVP